MTKQSRNDRKAENARAAATGQRAGDAAQDQGASTIQTAEPQRLSVDDPTLDELDAAGADSFPASDPPAMTSPTKKVGS